MTAPVQPHIDVNRRHDFVLLFDVQDGNPNGDPDSGNLPRIDPETMQGLVTDVSIKRKIRDYVDIAGQDQGRNKIYVQRGSYLVETRARVFGERAEGHTSVHPSEAARWMCEEFFDIRMFGAVMSMREYNSGQVRGPIQLTFARSIDPIIPQDLTIAQVSPERPGDRTGQEEGNRQSSAVHATFGRKASVPYGLYTAYGFFNPHFGKQTGVTPEDMKLFWIALVNMWDLDRSSSRGLMACRGLYVFTHESPLGNAPAHRLFECVRLSRKSDVEVPRHIRDYTITVETGQLPSGVTLTTLEG